MATSALVVAFLVFFYCSLPGSVVFAAQSFGPDPVTGRKRAFFLLWLAALGPLAWCAVGVGMPLFFLFPFGVVGALAFGVSAFAFAEGLSPRLRRLGLAGGALLPAAAFVIFRLTHDVGWAPYVHYRAGGGFFGSYTQPPGHIRFLMPVVLALVGAAFCAVLKDARDVGAGTARPRDVVVSAAVLVVSLASTLFLAWHAGLAL